MAKNKAENVGLPEEIIIDILYRLPPKSIGLFRCVSKKYNYFLSDPKFIKAHLTIHPTNKEYEQKLIVADFGLLNTITLAKNPHDELIDVISDELDFHALVNNFISVDGSCNGLVLVSTQKRTRFLINPTTLKYHEIPKFDMALPEKESKCMYGFGYDVVSDDYKVICLSYYDTDESDNFDTFVDVYSVRKGLWRRLENSPYDHSLAEVASGVLVNGALHWSTSLISHYSCVISAFHLSDEKFLELSPPDDKWSYFDFQLLALRGHLCIFTNVLGASTITFCLMKEYGVKDSWTKFSIAEPSLEDIFCTPLCLMTDDNILMDAEDKLMAYNLKENVVWDPAIDACHVMYKAQTFIESLISPSYGFGTEG